MMKKFRSSLAVAVVLPLSGLLSAADSTLPPIVITATRTAQTVDQTLAAVTVITRQEIEQLQVQSVPDLLRGVPGLTMANNGGPGQNASLYLRGTSSNHMLVLIDGIKIGSATLGAAAFQHLPIDQIERIEIVRGPRSSLYGSEAIGGVIQIFTRRGQGALTPSLSLGVGSDATRTLSAGLSGGDNYNWYSINLSSFETDGYDVRCGALNSDCSVFEPDDDGYKNRSIALRGGHSFNNGIEIELHALQAEGENEFDSITLDWLTGDPNPNESKTVQQVVGVALRLSPTEFLYTTLTLGSSKDRSDNLFNSQLSTRFDTTRDVATLQNDITLAAGQLLTFGLDYQNDKINSTMAFPVTSRNNRALFTQYQGAFGEHDLQLALRGDDNEQFGHQKTGSLAWGADFQRGIRLTAAYGTAFNAPTFNDLYWPGSGNDQLKPEESHTFEVGMNTTEGQSYLALNLFQTDVKNLIDWAPTVANPAIWAPSNISSAKIRGVEIALNSTAFGWQFNTTVTLLNPVDESNGSNKGNLLPRRAAQTVYLDLQRRIGKITYGTTLNVQGESYDDAANTTLLSGYGVLDLRIEYAIDSAWRVAGRIENSLDKTYETVKFYSRPDRGFFLFLHYRPPAE